MTPLMATVTASLASFHLWSAAPLPAEDVYCTARVVYGEARGSFIDAPMVAFVLQRRALASGRGICAEAKASRQFAGYRTAAKLGEDWASAVEVSMLVLSNMTVDVTRGATHFHSTRVASPVWAKPMREIGRTASHVYLAKAKPEAGA